MIIIKRNPRTKKFYVTYTGKNNEILGNSENLNSKASCWKNIGAMHDNFKESSKGSSEEPFIAIKDETVKKPSVYLFNLDNGEKFKQ